MYSLRTGKNTKQKLFDAGFWIAIATLVYSWSSFYIVLVYIIMVVEGKQSFKNFVIPIIGFITPIFIFFTGCFYLDDLALFFESFNYEPYLKFVAYRDFKFLIPIAYIIVIMLWSVGRVSVKVAFLSNNIKLSWLILLTHLFISAIIITLSPVKDGSEMVFILFPLVIILTNNLQKSASSLFKNIILYFFLAISIGVYFL